MSKTSTYKGLVDLCQRQLPDIERAATEGKDIFSRYIKLNRAISGIKTDLRSRQYSPPGFLKSIGAQLTGKAKQQNEGYIRHIEQTAARIKNITDIQKTLDKILANTYGPQYGIDDLVLMRDDSDCQRIALIEEMTLDKVKLHYLGPEGMQWSLFPSTTVKCRLVQTIKPAKGGPVALYEQEQLKSFGFADPKNSMILGYQQGEFHPLKEFHNKEALALEPGTAPKLSMDESKLIATLAKIDMEEKPFAGAAGLLDVYRRGIRVESALDIIFERDLIKEGERVVVYFDNRLIIGKVIKHGEQMQIETPTGKKAVPYSAVPCILFERPVRKYADIPDGTPVSWKSDKEYLGFLEQVDDTVRIRDSWPDGKIISAGSYEPEITRLFPVRKSWKMTGGRSK